MQSSNLFFQIHYEAFFRVTLEKEERNISISLNINIKKQDALHHSVYLCPSSYLMHAKASSSNMKINLMLYIKIHLHFLLH